MSAKVSIVIATYNMVEVIWDTMKSCKDQDYDNIEIVVYDDCSTDGTEEHMKNLVLSSGGERVKYFKGKENVGVGEAFNQGIKRSTGDIIVLMCADDIFTSNKVLSDIVKIFDEDPYCGHVSRWYYQFIDEEIEKSVRRWRTLNPVMQANNPSGLAFRKDSLIGLECSNNMFIETSKLVKDVLDKGWNYSVLKYDSIAVRVHNSTSTKPGYFLKRRVSSPVMDWWSLGVKEIAKDHCSLIQIKNGFTMKALFEEIWNFIKLRPINLIDPRFWFFSILSIVTPRFILRKIPDVYRRTWGRWTTRRIMR